MYLEAVVLLECQALEVKLLVFQAQEVTILVFQVLEVRLLECQAQEVTLLVFQVLEVRPLEFQAQEVTHQASLQQQAIVKKIILITSSKK